MVLFIVTVVTEKFFEVRRNNESLDTFFRGHILRLIILKNFRVKEINYFFTRDLFFLKSLVAL